MEEITKNISFTTWIAIYAAFVATVTLVFLIYIHCTEKGKLKLNCFIDKFRDQDGNEMSSSDCLIFEIINVGRKAVEVDKVGATVKNEQKHLRTEEPRRPELLHPTQQLVRHYFDLSILNENLQELWVKDTLGRVYKVRKHVVRDLIDKVKKQKRK